ncbi:MAG: SpoIIE family protein phosphatase [bacterium]|nr:SpoIIE family protein phosphatase [candidate division KSB1 bacterium]MDH7560515.1 SpoIIE family protein phosphatase [bacterium]
MDASKNRDISPAVDGIARQLDERLVELQALFEMSQVLNSSLNLKTILDNLLLTPMGRMMISKGMALLYDGHGRCTVATVKGMPRELVGKIIETEVPPTGPILVEESDAGEFSAASFFRQAGIQLLAPMVSSTRTTGMICFGPKITNVSYTPAELEFLGSLSNIAATAVENGLIVEELRRVNRELDKKIQELNTLFDIGKELSTTLDSEKIVALLSYAVMGELVVNRCTVFLREGDSMHLVADRGGQPAELTVHCQEGSHFLRGLCDAEKPFLVEECDDEEIRGVFGELGVALVAPMRYKEQTRGLIAVGQKLTGLPFSDHDIEFLTTLGNYAMICLENARLFQETLEKQRMEEELAIAKQIQQRLLPTHTPALPGFDLAGMNISSREVGGDYYDWIVFDQRHCALAIADVSGKGAPAALLMANLQASLRALAAAHGNVAEMVRRINNLIHASTDLSKFITFFYAELDVEEKRLTYCNAGHNPPLLLRADGNAETLEQGGLILGMMRDVSFEVGEIILQPGDVLLLYTDGVSEALNEAEEEFGEERLAAALREFRALPAAEIVSRMHERVGSFCGEVPQSDDLTMVVLRVLQAEKVE